MIELKEGRYFSLFLFLENGKDFDWLGALFHDPGGPWQILYRFRYYVDDKVDDSDDIQNWYEVSIDSSTPEPVVMRDMSELGEVVAARFGCRTHKLFLQTSDQDKVFGAISAESWAHVTSRPLERPQ